MWSWRKIKPTDTDFEFAKQIRNSVFVEEQGVSAREEYDAFEHESQHYLVFDSAHPIATARWRETNNGIKLERFAVLPAHRGKGVGRFLVAIVLKDALPLNKSVYLNAQIQVVDFYQKFGFKKEGELFKEAGIQHLKMCFKPA